MKKGFTLIELLAVIVILAIIALIATPIVLNIIAESKESAGLRSAEMYLDAVEYGMADTIMNNKTIPNGTHTILKNGNICIGTYSDKRCTGDIVEVEVNGEVPSEGSTITITDGKIEGISLLYGDKIVIKNNQGNLEYSICKLVSGDVNTQGAKYSCKVDPNKESYPFYLINKNNDDTANLIMEANINTSGEMVIKNITTDLGLVAWYDSDPNIYNNTYGPIHAMEYLYNATRSWTNVDPVNYTYNDIETQGGASGYTSFVSTNGILTINGATITTIGTEEEPLRTRMPIYSINSNITEVTGVSISSYLYKNLYSSSSDGPYGYWTLSSIGSNSSEVYYVDVGGIVKNHYPHFYNQWCYLWNDCGIGVRPVITVKI